MYYLAEILDFIVCKQILSDIYKNMYSSVKKLSVEHCSH